MQPRIHRTAIKKLHLKKAFAEDQPGQFLASQDIVRHNDSYKVSSFTSSSHEETIAYSNIQTDKLRKSNPKLVNHQIHKRTTSELPVCFKTQDILTNLTQSTQDENRFRKKGYSAKDDVFGLDKAINTRKINLPQRKTLLKPVQNGETSETEAFIRKIIEEKKEVKCADSFDFSTNMRRSAKSRQNSFVDLHEGMEKILNIQEKELKKQSEKRNELKKQLLNIISRPDEDNKDAVDLDSTDRISKILHNDTSFTSNSTHNGPGSTFLLYDTLDGFDRIPEFPPEFFETHDIDQSLSCQRITESTKLIEDEVEFLKKSLQILNEKIRNDNPLKPPPSNRKVISFLLTSYLEGDILQEVLQVFNSCRYTDQFVLVLEVREFAGLYERDDKSLTKLVGVSGTPNIIDYSMIQKCYKYSIDKTALKLIENNLGDCDVVTIELCNI